MSDDHQVKEIGFIPSVDVALKRMKKNGIWVSERIFNLALKQSGEK